MSSELAGGVRHVVVFRWNEGVTPDDVALVEQALATLPGLIPELRAYRFGPDLGMNDGNFEFAVVADFDSVDHYLAYRDHPEHRRIIAELIAPRLASRAAVQYALA